MSFFLKEFSYSSFIADLIIALIFELNLISALAFKSIFSEDRFPEAEILIGSEKDLPIKLPAISLAIDNSTKSLLLWSSLSLVFRIANVFHFLEF